MVVSTEEVSQVPAIPAMQLEADAPGGPRTSVVEMLATLQLDMAVVLDVMQLGMA